MISFIKFLIRHFKTVSFFGGFAIDLFLLPKTTSPYYIWIGPIDIGIVLLVLLIRQSSLRNLVKRNKRIKKEFKNKKDEEIKSAEDLKTRGHRRIEKFTGWSTFAVSFFLGTLLSHTLVYYLRSADVLQMWPVFLIVLAAIVINEFFYKSVPDIILFYIALTFYILFNVPIVLNSVNTYTFFISILVAVIVTSIITTLLQRIYLSKKDFIFLIFFSVFFPFLILRLYYMNYIPAVPLELGEGGFYSEVIKSDSPQGVVYKKEEKGLVIRSKYFFLKDDYYDLSSLNNGRMYFYSSIVSPANVSAEITNVWEKYDFEKKVWVKSAEIEYPISGGREGGYRGYSEKSVTTGEWRVRVLADGRLVGLKKISVQ